jgi:SHS2 domain-containing protein
MGGEPAADAVIDSIALHSVDRTALLVDFLNEALLRCHLRRHRYTAAEFASLTETSLAATLTAAPVAAFHEDVKAVTYHEADVRRDANGSWRTVLVLDI